MIERIMERINIASCGRAKKQALPALPFPSRTSISRALGPFRACLGYLVESRAAATTSCQQQRSHHFHTSRRWFERFKRRGVGRIERKKNKRSTRDYENERTMNRPGQRAGTLIRLARRRLWNNR